MRSQLESALLVSQTNENKEILKRIRIRLEKKGIGWDGFHLTYFSEPPLNITFTPSIIQYYEQISHFLWQLKRVEYVLILNRRNYPLKSLPMKELYKFHVVHNHMLRFINDLQLYIMNDSINSAWKIFIKKLNNAQNLVRNYFLF